MSGDCDVSSAFSALKDAALRGWTRQRISYEGSKWLVSLTHPMNALAEKGDKFWQHKSVMSELYDYDDVVEAINDALKKAKDYEGIA